MDKLKRACSGLLQEEGCSLEGVRAIITAVMCVGCSAFFLYTSYFGSFPNMIQRAILFMWVLPVIFMTKPVFKKYEKLSLAIDLLFSIACLAAMYYITYDVKGMGWQIW